MTLKLIEGWKDVLLRSATSWVATALGALLGAFGAQWGIMFAVLPFLPFWLQMPLAIVLGVFFVGGPIVLARITDQPKLEQRIKAKSDGVV